MENIMANEERLEKLIENILGVAADPGVNKNTAVTIEYYNAGEWEAGFKTTAPTLQALANNYTQLQSENATLLKRIDDVLVENNVRVKQMDEDGYTIHRLQSDNNAELVKRMRTLKRQIEADRQLCMDINCMQTYPHRPH